MKTVVCISTLLKSMIFFQHTFNSHLEGLRLINWSIHSGIFKKRNR